MQPRTRRVHMGPRREPAIPLVVKSLGLVVDLSSAADLVSIEEPMSCGAQAMTNDRVRVLIATTQGPVEIEAIIDLEAGGIVVVALGSTAQVISGLMTSYRAFVAKGSGVIARSFGHDAFRTRIVQPNSCRR